MGELSDRFAALMARMAQSDAELFRTIGAQNASLRQFVDDLALPVLEEPPTAAALAPAGLLPPDACEPKALRARFGKVAAAQAWLESQIGPAPKKPTWDVIGQTCRHGAWPAPARRGAATAKGLTTDELEQRLSALEHRLQQHLEERFQRLEGLLTLLVTALETPSRR